MESRQGLNGSCHLTLGRRAQDAVDLGIELALRHPAEISADRAGLPDVTLFPYEAWRRIMAGLLRPSALADPASAGDPAGLPALREAIARHVGVSRSVRASGPDIVVTAGIQQALDLIVRVLLEPGDVVAVEDPGYPPVRMLLTAASRGQEFVLDLDEYPEALPWLRSRIALD